MRRRTIISAFVSVTCVPAATVLWLGWRLQSGEERVVPMTPSSLQFGWVVMFPDGRSALVNTPRPKDNAIYRVDVASGTWTSLKKPGERDEVTGFPSGISPDGRTIYFNRYPMGAALPHFFARDLETGLERELFRGVGQQLFALSPDGKQLAVGHPDGKDLVIDVLPAAGGPK